MVIPSLFFAATISDIKSPRTSTATTDEPATMAETIQGAITLEVLPLPDGPITAQCSLKFSHDSAIGELLERE